MSEQNENFYFWLGADGELEDVGSEEGLQRRVAEVRDADSRWRNVEVGDSSDIPEEWNGN